MSTQILMQSLGQLQTTYEELLEISLHKKETIISRDYDELVKTMNAESRKLKKAREQEADLQEAIQQFLRGKGIQSRLQLKLTEIMRLVFDPEERSSLEESRLQLEHTLEELRAVNTLNQELIEQSLSFIDYSLNLMTSGWEDDTTYAPPQAQDRKAQARSMFDTRA